MSKKIILICIAFLFLIQACYKDNSSIANRELSEIEVVLDFGDRKTLELNLNDTYALVPQIEQKRELPLQYEWQVNYKVVSTERNYEFFGDRLGTFKVRLKVSNEDGSTFKEFTVRVNSQYEEGLMILGEDDSGEGKLSFIPKDIGKLLSETPVTDVDYNSFEKSNPNHVIGKNPTDIGVRDLQVFLSSEEGGISVINYKTLELDGVIKAADLPGFRPINMHIQDNESVSSIIVSRNGKLFSLATLEFLVSNYTMSRADTITFDMKSQMVALPYYTLNYVWDAKNSKLWNFWYYGDNTEDKLFGQKLIHFFAANEQVYIVSADKNNPALIKKTVFGELLYKFGSDADQLDLVEDLPAFVNNNMTLKYESITLLDEYYQKLVYANGRDIYRWYYNTVSFPTSPYISLDIPGVVTCIQKDPTNKEMYVGVYDANASGLKGSVVVYDLDTGRKKATFANISDKPVKLFFKVRK